MRTGLVLALLLSVAFSFGYMVHAHQIPPYQTIRSAILWVRTRPLTRSVYYYLQENYLAPDRRKGFWEKTQAPPDASDLSPEQAQQMARLRAVGYLSGYEASPEKKGVTAYDRERAYDGLSLYTSGDSEKAVLIDMDGTVLHEWRQPFHRAFPDSKEPRGVSYLEFWRRAYMYPNGDLLAIFDGFGLIKLDMDSNLIWANPARIHHDLFVDENGFIHTLSREAKVIPRLHPVELVLKDFIVVLDINGNIVKKISVLEAFERSPYASFLAKMERFGDVLHTNTIEILDGSHAARSPVLAKGNALISSPTTNAIAIVDMETESVVWALSGLWAAQHQPTLLANGNMLLFDNEGHFGMSKVVEFDPLTQEIRWLFGGNEVNGFSSPICGSNQRLPNGNTLITETTSGRAFEVTEDLDVVWTYYTTPHEPGTTTSSSRRSSRSCASSATIPSSSFANGNAPPRRRLTPTSSRGARTDNPRRSLVAKRLFRRRASMRVKAAQLRSSTSTRASLKHAPPATTLTWVGVRAVDTRSLREDFIHAPFGM